MTLRTWANQHRYRWTYEASYKAEKDPRTRGNGDAYVEVVCRNGVLYPCDRGVCAYVKSSMVARLLSLPGVRIRRRGDKESELSFPFSALDRVAAVLKPKRKRAGNLSNLTPEARAKGREALRALTQSAKRGLETTTEGPGTPG
jgi:hypothetical protein